MMELSRLLNKEDMMTSIELCELINKFRIEEGESLKAHKRIMQERWYAIGKTHST